ncbi:hypothetical protein [Glycomyces rhizosphaerae]|uniref:DUF308 domain-containing protein n=1 Tax=Glycomyces rhizosphaerae TaxID=2054422 RepID=A0ABV7Q0X3_9ACTN
MDNPAIEDPPGTRPVYQRPMPWQIIVALVLIGLAVLSSAMTAVLTFSVVAALSALIWIALGVCIVARLDRARNLAMAFNLVNILIAVLLTLAFAALGAIAALTAASGAFSLGMIFLLGSDASKAYTYKVGLRSSQD